MKKTYIPPFAEKICVEKSNLLVNTANVDEAASDVNRDTKVDVTGSDNEHEGAKNWGQLWEADWD